MLLIVLALLAMFGLIAVAFVVISGQAQRSARSVERFELATDPPPQLLRQAALQVFRGSNSAASVMGPHSLLEDIYGNSWMTGIITIVNNAVCGGQLIEFTINPTPANPAVRTGCVVSMFDGPAAGQSSRIVGFNPTSGNWQMLAFDGPNQPVSGNSMLINGVPFSGTGFGYDTATGKLNATNANGPIAYQPNAPENRNPPGGANEDYDAADYQNMLLAGYDASGAIIPSLHRPALCGYWSSNTTIPKRNYILRPLTADHPNFTTFNSSGPWDVDNDGDGVPDSVWVDLGMPVRSTADGRLYKPLFAILCVDLDGRLNLNAHGCLPQVNTAYYGAEPATAGLAFAGGTAPSLHRGLGMGPAEINLGKLLDTDTYQQILYGNAAYEGRYGRSGLPGVNAVADVLNLNKWFEYGPNYWDFSNVNKAGSYGAPPDPFGQGVVALDVAGRPMYLAMGGNTLDNPYELDLSVKAARGVGNPAGVTTVYPYKPNNLFSPAELERVLRPISSTDPLINRDSPGLPPRLADLVSSLSPATARLSVTTESWDLPCPNVTVVPRSTTRLKHVTDLLVAKGIPSSAWSQLLPPELLSGLRMNINRPFGNGRDDNGIGMVDPPPTASATENDLLTLSGVANVPFSYDGITYGGVGTLAANSLQARQLEARYLYVLMCLTSDLAYLNSASGLGSSAATARFIAQWAINAVSFRDRDSIMKRFDYDPAWTSGTATGWNPVTSGTCTVWSCERPELLITETLAFHDRNSVNTGATHSPVHIRYDQAAAAPPQGSLFIELYNPAGPTDAPTSDADKFTSGTTTVGCVRLNATTPSLHPVWRLAIVSFPTGTTINTEPDDPNLTPQQTIERTVYFVNPVPAAITGGTKYYPTTATAAPVLPGRYAVIGPAATTRVGKRSDGVTANTRRIELTPNSDPNVASDPSAANYQVKVFRNSTTGDANELPADIKPPVAVVVDQPRRLSVSEPVAGYAGYPNTALNHYPIDFPNAGPLKTNGTTPTYRAVHLQRLANPLKDYNNTASSADYNPYLTIDTQPIDLTVYNGNVADTINEPYSETSGNFVTNGTKMFAAHQRGETNVAADGVNNLWKQTLSDKPLVAASRGNADHYYDYVLQHTLGYLNYKKLPTSPTTAPTFGGDPRTGTDPTIYPYSCSGDPPDASGPFPWLTWNNRPYVSPMELLLVPTQRSSQLLRVYNITSPYPHLLNFFRSDAASASTSPQFHRILEYLNVPSWFTGTDVQVNRTPIAWASDAGAHAFHPPFNRISTYREPGRINLNTIYRKEVFFGLMNDFPGMGNDAFWAKFVASRQGSSAASEFANPFRSYGGASLTGSLNPEINTTLLRADPDDATKPLFQYTSANAAEETSRNPYFRYQGLMRLGNLTTTRSNVYAVWITVGYFEVEPGAITTAQPDGYTLGTELGTDTGEIERHRSFFIFDRSIPVGFQRGQDLNVNKAILVDRFIE